jgi:DNA-binding beta-propeller fold protein YncE
MRALMVGLGVVAMLVAAVLATRDNTAHVNNSSQAVAAAPTARATPSVIPPTTATPFAMGKHAIYVLDVHNGGLLTDLHVIDADARKDVSIVRLRYSPEIIFSPDGAKMYVLDAYYTKATRGDWREVLSVFDARTFQVLVDDVPVPNRVMYKVFPEGDLWFFTSPDGKYLFVEKYGDPDVHALRMTVLDEATFKTAAEYPLPYCEDEHLVALGRSRLACAANGNLDIFDALTGERTRTIDLPDYQAWLTLLTPKSNLWYRLTSKGIVTVVDASVAPPRVLMPEKQLPTPPDYSVGWSRLAALSPDGSRLYIGFVATSGELFGSGLTNLIRVYDTQTWQRVGEIHLGDPAWSIAVSNDGTQLYTMSPRAKSLSIFDTTTLRELGVMRDLGESPAQILVPPAPH